MKMGRRWLLYVSMSIAFCPAVGARLEAREITRREQQRLAAEARELMEQRKYSEAAQRFEEATAGGASEGDLARWWPLLGRCYEHIGNYSKALTAYQDAQRLRSKSVERMLDLARIYNRVDLNESAIDLYEKILKREKRRDVTLILAELYYRTGRLGLAHNQAERYLVWEPQDLAALKLMARIEEGQGSLSKAAHRWEGILSRDPSAEAYFHLGRLWAIQNQYDLAERAFRKSETLGLSSPAVDVQRGIISWLRGDLQAAGAAWRRAREKNPRLPLVSFLLALRNAQTGNLAQAESEMRQAAQESTTYIQTLANTFFSSTKEWAEKPGASKTR